MLLGKRLPLLNHRGNLGPPILAPLGWRTPGPVGYCRLFAQRAQHRKIAHLFGQKKLARSGRLLEIKILPMLRVPLAYLRQCRGGMRMIRREIKLKLSKRKAVQVRVKDRLAKNAMLEKDRLAIGPAQEL